MAYSRGKEMLKASILPRKSSRRGLTPIEEANWYIEAGLDKEGFDVKFISCDKGYGVFARKTFAQGEFLMEYVGEVLSGKEGERRDKGMYRKDKRSYLYFFYHSGKEICIDATNSIGRFGRLVNDAEEIQANSRMKKVSFTNSITPHLVLFAKKMIAEGEEITYDYGDDEKNMPWRNKDPVDEQINSCDDEIKNPFTDDEEEKDMPVSSPLSIDMDENPITNNEEEKDSPMSPRRSSPAPMNMDEKLENPITDEEEKDLPMSPRRSSPAPMNMDEKLENPITDEEEKDLPMSPRRSSPAPMNMDEKLENPITDEEEKDLPMSPRRSSPAPMNMDEKLENPITDEEEKDLPMSPRRSSPAPMNMDEKLQKPITAHEEEKDLALSSSPLMDMDCSDSDHTIYEPSSHASDSESDSDISAVIPLTRHVDISKVPNKKSCHDENMPGERTHESPSGSIHVMTAANTREKRLWDKKHFCVFCMKPYAKLARHFEQVHSSEVEVAKALSYPKKSTERFRLLEILRSRGDYAHNYEVYESNNGVLIPWKRPSEETEPTDYAFCENCLALFLKTDIWKHKKKCVATATSGNDSHTKTSRRGQHQCGSAGLMPVSRESKEQMRKVILDTMANDKVAFIARRDDLIVTFGCKQFAKIGHEKHQHQYIKQKMRELARFLISIRSSTPNVVSLTDCITPVLFQNVIQAVRDTSGYNSQNGTYGVPSLAIKLGYSLKKCAKYFRSLASQAGDEESKKRATDFIELIDDEWNTEISSQAAATLHRNTFNNPKRIPLAKDIRELNLYLAKKAKNLKEDLEIAPVQSTWREFAEVTLAQLLLFNRRRSGEIQRTELNDYVKGLKAGTTLQEEIAAGLSRFELSLAKTLARIEIRGKRGRRVPVLFTSAHQAQIKVLNNTRQACGILSDNIFLFARSGDTLTPIRSCDVLRKYAHECEAEKPELLTSTALRKHVATVSQILNLKDHELDILASFLGHDVRIHREYYRLQDDLLQLVKVSKILLELESGSITRFQGKSLDEIDVDVNETVDLPLDLADNDDADADSANNEEEYSDGDSSRNQVFTGKRIPAATHMKSTKRPWSSAEKEAVKKHLDKFIRLSKVPGKAACEEAKKKAPVLVKRDWKQIKFCVKNIISALSRRK